MSLKPLFYLFFTLTLIGTVHNSVVAQVGNNGNGDLGQEEIQKLLKKATEAGYSLDQIEEFARLKGFSEAQISQLRTRLSTQNTGGQQTASGTLNTTRTFIAPPQQALPAPQRDSNGDQIFGSSVFNNPNLTFTPNLNLPTPANYVLGPGDQINIELWGQAELSASLTISPDGYIRPSNLGPIYLNGLTVEKATRVVNRQLDKIYDGLIAENGQEPTVFSLITLGQIRSINVTVVGDVVAPGNYNLNSLSTIYSALYAAGGPNGNGTYRTIQLVRDNKVHTTVDIYDFLTKGMRSNDVNLRHNDVILVKPYAGRVAVRGSMKRIGFFEIIKDEVLADVLAYAGGYAQNADRSKLLVTRYSPEGTRLITVAAEEADAFQLYDGDIIQVDNFNNRFLNRVVIDGAVISTGQYELSEGLTLTGLIQRAGGLRGDAYKDKVFVYRISDTFSQQVLSYELDALIKGTIQDPILQPDDIVEIKSTFNVTEEAYLGIVGEVGNPGIYPYLENLTPADLILLAGGIRENASKKIEVSRLKKQDDGSFKNEVIVIDLNDDQVNNGFTLSAFDRVYVRQNAGFSSNNEVRVTGEVKRPGLYVIVSNQEKISDLIRRTGGLMQAAYPKGAILIRKSELSSQATGLVIDRSALADLRRKILLSSGLKTVARDSLTARIDRIAEENYVGIKASVASEVRRRALLSDNPFQNDSISSGQQLPDYEPLALDLEAILSNPGGEADLFLRPGDVISIPPQLETVRVSGEVVSNVLLKHRRGKRFKDYVNESGGFVHTALKGRSYVQYPNGERAGVRRFLFFKSFPKVLPGSTIVVAKKPQRTPLNLATVVSSVGSVLTLVLLVDRLNN